MSDNCHKCGRELVDLCPECHQPVEVYSRVVGYMRPISTWNPGKVAEFNDRKEYWLSDEPNTNYTDKK